MYDDEVKLGWDCTASQETSHVVGSLGEDESISGPVKNRKKNEITKQYWYP